MLRAFYNRGEIDGKDITTMAAHIICRFRHLSEKQKVINHIIASSNCWTGINDYRFKPAREIAMNIKKARRPSDLNYK